jgi:hypothetical protein
MRTLHYCIDIPITRAAEFEESIAAWKLTVSDFDAGEVTAEPAVPAPFAPFAPKAKRKYLSLTEVEAVLLDYINTNMWLGTLADKHGICINGARRMCRGLHKHAAKLVKESATLAQALAAARAHRGDLK